MAATTMHIACTEETLEQLHRTIHFLSRFGACRGFDRKDRNEPHVLGDALKLVLLELSRDAEEIKDTIWPSSYFAQLPDELHHGHTWWLR